MNKAYPIQKSTLTNNISIKKKKLLVIIKLKRTQLQCTWYLWLTWQWHTVLSYFTQHSIFIYNLVPYTYLRVVCLSSCWVEISAKRAHWASNTSCKNKKGEKKRIKKTLLCVSLVMQWLTTTIITKQYHQVYVIVSDNRFLRRALESNGNASVMLQSK